MTCFRCGTHEWRFARKSQYLHVVVFLAGLGCSDGALYSICARVCVLQFFSSCFGSPVCLCSSGGLAAEEPGECAERRPVRSHPHTEEKASEHPELDTSSAQERPLETTGPAGKHRAKHTEVINSKRCNKRFAASR